MKIVLSLLLCSAVAGDCPPPFTWPEYFKDSYDCMTFGYEESKRKMIEIGREEANKHEIFVKFFCIEEDELLDYNKEIEKAPASKGIQTGL